VLVKNPMTADIGLWLGAIERMAHAGVRKIGAIHRGFTSTLETRYRNAPHWGMPIELRRQLPDMPLICDPSHICGKAELIPAVAQEAMDLLFDGLMVEVHPDPFHALSDAGQQLTPDRFFSMVDSLVLSREESDNPGFKVMLDTLRGRVDEVDVRILELLGQRMELVSRMGRLKAEESVSTFQPHRWQEIVDDRVARGTGFNLSEGFVLEIMQSIHEEAIRRQETDRLDGPE
jgi:chorismate mutase